MNEQRAVVGGIRGEEIETGGPFCEVSATPENSVYAHFRLARNPRPFLQNRQGAGARGHLSALAGPPGLDSAQYCSSVFLFLLSPEPKQL